MVVEIGVLLLTIIDWLLVENDLKFLDVFF
jgi:hypothetical protein